MCIIAAAPQAKLLSKKRIKRMVANNPDGAGLAWHDGEELIWVKPLWSVQDVLDELSDIPGDAPCLFHARIATSGRLDYHNTHPHIVSDNVLMAHNGILEGGTCTESDTVEFCRDVLQPLDLDTVPTGPLLRLIELAIEPSKMAFIDVSGAISIANEDYGTWSRGVWYSNTTYRPARTYRQVKGKRCLECGARITGGALCDTCYDVAVHPWQG